MECKLLTVNKAANYLSVHPKTVRCLTYLGENNGGLRCVRIGRAVRIEKSALDDFITNHITGRVIKTKLLGKMPADLRFIIPPRVGG